MERTETARQLSKAAGLLQRWKESRNAHVTSVLQARAVLLDECEDIMRRVEEESRSMTGDERRVFDFNTLQINAINADLAEYKRERNAGLVALGIDPSEARYAF